MSVRFIALSGTTNVTENLYIYEYLADDKTVSDILVVDCGVGFPELGMHGVDLVIPDFEYLRQNKDKLRGVIVSQGHEDHHGALPFLLQEIKVPVYAPALTAAFIEDKLKDQQVKDYDLKVYDPDKDVLTIGPFKITAFRVPHSIPDTLGFAIDTPEGQLFHVAEHKFDPQPVGGVTFEIKKAKALAAQGALSLASDCLGANRDGFTESENEIQERIGQIVTKASGRVFFTTISSNISRVQQVMNIAQKTNRKVAFVGRSIKRKSQMAHDLGYLHYPQNLVIPLHEAQRLPEKRVLYIVAGSYGQVGSSLFRLATAEHKALTAKAGDTVIFSSNPGPPYSKESIDFVVDNLIEAGLDVHYYDLDEGLYVSGHGSKKDIIKLFEIVSPKFFIPIGGTIRFMHAYKKLVQEMGKDPGNVFELKPGEMVVFKNGQAEHTGRIKVRQVLVDGLSIGEVGRTILQERDKLSEHGVAVAIVKIDSQKGRLAENPEIISRGFVFTKTNKKLFAKAGQGLKRKLNNIRRLDARSARYVTIEFLTQLLFKETGRRPVVIPVVFEV